LKGGITDLASNEAWVISETAAWLPCLGALQGRKGREKPGLWYLDTKAYFWQQGIPGQQLSSQTLLSILAYRSASRELCTRPTPAAEWHQLQKEEV
jgi:hypothetical protein